MIFKSRMYTPINNEGYAWLFSAFCFNTAVFLDLERFFVVLNPTNYFEICKNVTVKKS